MNYDMNWLQRCVAWLRRSWTWGGAATLLLTIFNVVVHGPRTLGEPLHFLIRKNQQNELNNGDLLVVFEIRSDHTTFVGWGAAVAAEHRDRIVVVPWTVAIFGAISAGCAGLFMWDVRRN